MFAVPFVNNETLSSKLRNAQEELVTNVKCTQVPRVHVQGLNHVFLHELCHVYVFWEEKIRRVKTWQLTGFPFGDPTLPRFINSIGCLLPFTTCVSRLCTYANLCANCCFVNFLSIWVKCRLTTTISSHNHVTSFCQFYFVYWYIR